MFVVIGKICLKFYFFFNI